MADIVRIENGVFAEHWDVIQDEATKETIQEWASNVWSFDSLNLTHSRVPSH